MENVIEATILTGPFEGEAVLIPRILMIPTDLPFQFKRLQFPIRLAFAITINNKTLIPKPQYVMLITYSIIQCIIIVTAGDWLWHSLSNSEDVSSSHSVVIHLMVKYSRMTRNSEDSKGCNYI